ncbi:MAG: hypothetical protein IJ772_05190 [Bacilli bacterium]|nr:hypothetical protein [Bacilli bacterium]
MVKTKEKKSSEEEILNSREIMILFGQYYHDMHEIVKRNWKNGGMPIKSFLTQPLFASEEQLKDTLRRGKKYMKKEIDKIERKDYIKDNFPSLSPEEIEKLSNLSSIDVFFKLIPYFFIIISCFYTGIKLASYILRLLMN